MFLIFNFESCNVALGEGMYNINNFAFLFLWWLHMSTEQSPLDFSNIPSPTVLRPK